MIYVTGDTHGTTQRFNKKNCPCQKGDYIIVCGDFGYIWQGNHKDDFWLDWLAEKDFTILFVDGNYENFDALYDESKYPIVPKFQTTARRIRHNVYHLRRGHIYIIEGLSIFSLGGAISHDKDVTKEEWEQGYRPRKEGKNWWPQENVTMRNVVTAYQTIDTFDGVVDYIISHTIPTYLFRDLYSEDSVAYTWRNNDVSKALAEIGNEFLFKMWYAGHHHQEVFLHNRYQLLYESIIPIGTHL